MSMFIRSVLSPLKLAPSTFTKVHILLSPTVTNQTKQEQEQANGDQEKTPLPPFLPASCLPDLVEQCPSLSSGSFTPSPQLPNGHLQTIYSTLADTVDVDVVHYTRSVLLLPESGIISLDECDHEPENKDKNRPTVVITHGLTGGSQESYVRHCIKQLAKPKSEGGQGYRCIVVNFRGCANTPVTSSQLYSAGKTSDLRCAILYIQDKYPNSPLIGLGFSLGANVMAKYLGEEGDQTPLLGGIVCAAPFHLKKGSDLMENNTFRRNVYSRAMRGNLTRVGTKHASTFDLHDKLRPFLDNLIDPNLGKKYAKERGESSANSNQTLKFVDDCMTRMVGGYSQPYGEFPFETSDDYYNYSGALNFLKGLRRPMLALNADDDPIVAAESVEGVRHLMGHDLQPDSACQYGHTDYIVLATTQGGGHLGWWQGIRNPTRWLRKPVEDFCNAVFNESKKRSSTSSNRTAKTTTKEVLVELMPAELLPPYLTPSQHETFSKDSLEPVLDKQDPKYKQGARLPWLRTHILTQAPLLHPSMARQGWRGGEKLKAEKEFDVDAKGNVSEKDQDLAKGWCIFQGTMILDTTREEVGYLELPAWTRVAGAGEHFQGGKTLAGEYGLIDETDKADGTIAGL